MRQPVPDVRHFPSDDAAVRPAVYRYSAFGILFESELVLPELEVADIGGPADVRIRFRKIDQTAPDPGRSFYRYGASQQFMYWPTVGAFVISGSHTIDIDPAPEASLALLRLPLLGPVMAMLLHLRGLLVLHASAVRIAGRVAVFVGDKGAGKSTTTAAALERGHQLFTDDLLPISFNDVRRPLAAPGFPSVKLVHDCAGMFALGGADRLPAPTDTFPKEVRRLGGGFRNTSADLATIYVLERSDRASIRRCSPDEALRMVMRFAYIPLFDGKPWEADETRRHFSQCAMLASRVRVARLQTPSDLGRLDEIIACVEQDLDQLTGNSHHALPDAPQSCGGV